jgi:hypothetical protein
MATCQRHWLITPLEFHFSALCLTPPSDLFAPISPRELDGCPSAAYHPLGEPGGGVAMSSIVISLIVFAFVFGGALLEMFLRSRLPQHHLSDASKDVVKMGTGLDATMSALVLGLLISSAKNSYDVLSSELTGASSQIILLDGTLAQYGPEAKGARDLLRTSVAGVLDSMGQKGRETHLQLERPTSAMDSLYEKIQELLPNSDRQRSIHAQALNILMGLRQVRWLMYEQQSTWISMPLLIILVSWLTTLFISFGLFAPANGTVFTSLFVSAFSVSGAIFLILELYSPYDGLIKISSAPLQAAFAQLGK